MARPLALNVRPELLLPESSARCPSRIWDPRRADAAPKRCVDKAMRETPGHCPERCELRPDLRRTAVRSTALVTRQTCYGIRADLQAVAAFQDQWLGKICVNSRRIREKFGLHQRQELTRYCLDRRPPVRGPQMLVAAQAQARCDGGHRLAVAEELQRPGLPRSQDGGGPLGRLLYERPRLMHVGEGAASEAPARQPLIAPAGRPKASQADDGRPRGAAGRRPPTDSRLRSSAGRGGQPGDRRGRGLGHLTRRGARSRSLLWMPSHVSGRKAGFRDHL